MSSLAAVRIGLPAAMVLLGIVLIVSGGDSADGAGIVIIGSAALVFALNALLRSSLSEEGDREREQDARDFYGVHGRWPEEPGPEPEEPGPEPDDTAPPVEPPKPAATKPAHPGAIELTPPGGDRGGRTRRRPRRRPPRRPHPGP